MAYMVEHPQSGFSDLNEELKGKRQKEWINLGGQIMQKKNVDKLRSEIGSGKLKTWENIHNRYNDLWYKYNIDKQKHAFAILGELYGTQKLTEAQWRSALDKAVNIHDFISDQVYITRKKDYDNPFRHATYRNMEEMTAAIGTIEENSFIVQVRQETDDFRKLAASIKGRP